MTLKFFFTYIGVFLTFSVVLVAVVNQMVSGFSGGGKKPFFYGAFSSLIASCAAYLATLFSKHLFSVFWFLAAIYFVFGIIHVALVHKKYFNSGNQDKAKIIMGEIMFGLSIIFFSIVVFSALQYFMADEINFLFYPMLMSMLTFFIPFLLLQTFDAAYSIPSAVFKTWKYPNNPIDLPDEKSGEKILIIGFEIAKNPTDLAKTYFRAKAPESMNLGELYYHFINDYNEAKSETTIKYTDDSSASVDWWFRRKPRWYQRQRILDPYITIRENGIKENTVVICERINNDI